MKKSFILTMLTAALSLSAAVLENSTFQNKKCGWDTRKYWGGELTLQDQCLLLKTTESRKKIWGRALGLQLSQKAVNSENNFRITIEAKGKGEVVAGFLVYFKKDNGKSDYRFVSGKALTLTDTFQSTECTLDLNGIVPERIAPYVNIDGEGNFVYIRAIKIESGVESGILFTTMINKKSAPAVKAVKPAEPVKVQTPAAPAAVPSAGIIQNIVFTQGKKGWDTRKYWGGEVFRENDLLVVKSTNFKSSGAFWGRVLGQMLPPKVELADKCFKITVEAKGKGEFYPGFLITAKKPNGKNSYNYSKPAAPATLTDEFRKFSYTVNLAGTKPLTVVPFAEVRGENSTALLRNVVVEHADAGCAVTVAAVPAVKKSPAVKKNQSKEELKFISSDTFKKSLRGWSGRNYWGGKLTKTDTDMVLETTENKGKFWGRALGVRPRRTEFAGRRFRITVTAKGKGEFYPGFLVTYPRKGKKTDYIYAKAEKPALLDDKYRKYTFEMDFSDSAPLAVAPFVDIYGKNSAASIRQVRVEAVSGKNAAMSLISPIAVVVKGEKAPAQKFKFSRSDATVQTMQYAADGSSELIVQPEISDEHGLVNVAIQKEVDALTKVVVSADGAYAVGYALGVDKPVYDRLDSAAAKIKADKPLAILYLGDSLNDFDRGYNSVDQAAAFLHKYNPGKFSIYNYSVAGDYIIRVEERFLGKRTDNRYKGIFDRPYDLVIISLGNNDTRATSTGNYDNPLVPAAEIKPAFERVINILRKANPGVPVWILSASRSDSDKMVQKSNAAVARGKTGIRFGIAKHAENFNKEVQATVAAGKDLRYIDIYTPMCREFSPENYADGVHLSLKGHSLFAELLLKSFIK